MLLLLTLPTKAHNVSLKLWWPRFDLWNTFQFLANNVATVSQEVFIISATEIESKVKPYGKDKDIC